MWVSWHLFAGSDYKGGGSTSGWTDYANNKWADGQATDAVVTTASATWLITQCQLEVGSQASDFQHEDKGTTLSKCQRYFYQWVDGAGQNMGTGAYYNTGLFITSVDFPVTMRAVPTGSFVTGTDYYRIWRNGTYDDVSMVGSNIANASNKGSAVDVVGGVSGTTGHGGRILSLVDAARFAFDAEL